MFCIHVRRPLALAAPVLMVLALAAPAFAQTAMVKGKVTDAKGQPVEGAKVTIEFTEGTRKHEVKTNKRGEFIQVGVLAGIYRITAAKEGVGTATEETRIRLGDPTEVNLKLAVAAATGPSKEELALQKAFDEGVTAMKGSHYDEAIAKFTEAATLMPSCADCHYNVGVAYVQKKDLAKAEAAFKDAIKIKPDNSAPYTALANLYNSQKRFEEAAQMSIEASKYGVGAAGGAGGADAAFNQGVILWNANKVPEARAQFEQAVKLNPAHADARFRLGMAFLNEGKLPDAVTQFEEYLKIAPTGPNADQAKQMVAQLKK